MPIDFPASPTNGQSFTAGNKTYIWNATLGAWTKSQSSPSAPTASPTFTGTPTAPTAAADTNTTQVATTAFVVGQASATAPIMDGTATTGTSSRYARADHVHASDTSRIGNSLLTAKAAIVSATAANTPATLTVGANDTVLTADSSTSTGLAWKAPAASGPIVSHFFTTGVGSVTRAVPVGRYLVDTDATDTVVTVGANSRTGSGVLNVTSTGTSFGVSRPPIPAAPVEPATWTPRTSGFTGINTIYGLTFGNGVYVAGGAAGTLTSSTDAITWTARTSNVGAERISALTFGNGVYVAAGNNGVLTTSTNAITWTSRTSGFGTTRIYGLTFGNGVYVAVGDNAQMRTSTDAITWTTRASGHSSRIQAATFGNGVYVTVGLFGNVTTSTDATNWTARTSNVGTESLHAATFGSGVYVAAGTNGTMTSSTNAITWTSRTSGFGTSMIRAVTFGNGVYVAVGANGTMTTSTNAITWTSRTSGFGTSGIYSAGFGNNVYVAGGLWGAMTTAPASNTSPADQPTGVVVHALTNVT